jgi:hypothetical protein
MVETKKLITHSKSSKEEFIFESLRYFKDEYEIHLAIKEGILLAEKDLENSEKQIKILATEVCKPVF